MNKIEFIDLFEKIKIPEGCTDWKQRFTPISKALIDITPERLFRYRSINERTLEALKADLIFCSRAKDFNDPYDSLIQSPSFEAICHYNPEDIYVLLSVIENSLNNGIEIPKYIYDKYPSNIIDGFVFAKSVKKFRLPSKSEYIEWFKSYKGVFHKCIQKFSDKLRNSCAYACFSEEVTSVTMWGHYADYHKGFALEYDMAKFIYSGFQNIAVFPIIYSDRRYDATEMLEWIASFLMGYDTVRPDQYDMVKAALHKSSDWAYEKEWRLVKMNCPCEELHPAIHYSPCAIYYGSRIPKCDMEALHNIAVEKGLKEYIMAIDATSSKYDMKIIPLCKH